MKKTVPKQFEKLVDLMKANQSFAKGYHGYGDSKLNVREKWEEFAAELNALGPPMRAGSEWQRVWLDMKMKVKKIVAENKRQLRATGGGPCTIKALTPLQQDVDDLLNISSNVNATGQSFGIAPAEDSATPPPSPGVGGEVISPPLPQTASEKELETATTNTTSSAEACPNFLQSTNQRANPRKRKRLVDLEKERNDVLQKNMKLQEESIEQMKKMGESVAKLADAVLLQTQAMQQQTEAMNKIYTFLANTEL